MSDQGYRKCIHCGDSWLDYSVNYLQYVTCRLCADRIQVEHQREMAYANQQKIQDMLNDKEIEEKRKSK